MNEDPIVAEVRRIREQRSRRFGYDVRKIFADLITRRGDEDRSHPTVKDANKWTEDIGAKDALTVREEPPHKK